MNVAPSYFHWKINEKWNQKKSLAVWFPAYLLYVPGNFNLSDNPAWITSSEDSMQASSLFSVAREGSHEPWQNTKVVLMGDFPQYFRNRDCSQIFQRTFGEFCWRMAQTGSHTVAGYFFLLNFFSSNIFDGLLKNFVLITKIENALLSTMTSIQLRNKNLHKMHISYRVLPYSCIHWTE